MTSIDSSKPISRAAPCIADGVLLIDKPLGCTSFDVIRKLRRVCGFKKIGHAGTLDPFATGLLVILLGKATRCSQSLMCGRKTYEGTVRLGVETSTYDREGEVVSNASVDGLTDDAIQAILKTFLGDQYQDPPMFSAKKINGVPLYKLARKGQTVERVPNFITIFQCELLRYAAPDAIVKVCCSKGTYIRSLAHDLGKKLGVGGHLLELRRLQSGNFSVEQAVPLQAILDEPNVWRSHLIPYDALLTPLN